MNNDFDNPVLSLKNVSVGYSKKIIVHDINLCLQKGEIVSFIGPNGGGKSTILKTIARQLPICAGVIDLLGESIMKYSYQNYAQKVSYLSTEKVKADIMTCRDVVEEGRTPYTSFLGRLSAKDKREVENAIKACGAEGFIDMDFCKASDGQKQLVMISRAICQASFLLVLDEPESYLDIKHKKGVFHLLRKLCDNGMSAVISLHELDWAVKVSDIIVCVHNGGVRRIYVDHITKDDISFLCEVYETDVSCYFERGAMSGVL